MASLNYLLPVVMLLFVISLLYFIGPQSTGNIVQPAPIQNYVMGILLSLVALLFFVQVLRKGSRNLVQALYEIGDPHAMATGILYESDVNQDAPALGPYLNKIVDTIGEMYGISDKKLEPMRSYISRVASESARQGNPEMNAMDATVQLLYYEMRKAKLKTNKDLRRQGWNRQI